MKFRRSNNASYARSSGAGQKWVKREKIRADARSSRPYPGDVMTIFSDALRPTTSHRRPPFYFAEITTFREKMGDALQ